MSEVIRGLVVPNAVEVFSVDKRTNLAVAALKSLGLVGDEDMATKHIGEHMQRLHDSLSIDWPEAGVEPYFGIELSERFGLEALIELFDERQPIATVCDPLWDQYTAGELNSRQIGVKGVAASSKGLSGSCRAMVLGGDKDCGEPGLYFADSNLRDQREAAGKHELVNPADYVMLNAQRRVAGGALLDPHTVTCFPQLEVKPLGGDSWVPTAFLDSGRLRLYGSPDDPESYGGGVRISAGVKKADSSF